MLLRVFAGFRRYGGALPGRLRPSPTDALGLTRRADASRSLRASNFWRAALGALMLALTGSPVLAQTINSASFNPTTYNHASQAITITANSNTGSFHMQGGTLTAQNTNTGRSATLSCPSDVVENTNFQCSGSYTTDLTDAISGFVAFQISGTLNRIGGNWTVNSLAAFSRHRQQGHVSFCECVA